MVTVTWGDFNWRSGFHLRRNLVRGQLTSPKNHQARRVDLSRQLRVALRLWRRQQRRAWLAVGRPFPDWVFASVTGSALDEANVRKAFNRILDAAELDRRGPHEMRHTVASLPLQDGAPITRVSRQVGHKAPRSRCACTRTGYPTRQGIVWSTWSTRRPRTCPGAINDVATKKFSGLKARRATADNLRVGLPTVAHAFVDKRERRLVSRVGIEPTTRRLRAPSKNRKHSKP